MGNVPWADALRRTEDFIFQIHPDSRIFISLFIEIRMLRGHQGSN